MTNANTTDNAAKFAFYYMLSLVALVFMALSTGMIIFQVINKNIVDTLHEGSGRFSSEALKFAISALIISAPVFFAASRGIYRSLFSGALNRESGIRKWLTYFILFIASVVMIGWLIFTINNFLNGELTLKFLLKAVTAIGIAVSVFTFYYYDIRRAEVVDKKDRVISVYFYGTLAIIIAAFVSALFVVESPTVTRNRKLDNAILESFSQIDQAISEYYRENSRLPENLSTLREEYPYITDEDIRDKETGAFELNITGDRAYELCAVFRTSNTDESGSYEWYRERWPHEAGRQCLKQKVLSLEEEKAMPLPIR
ncbi:MAG: DUF5671 domain-containing protein [Candidatus Falkowbacteria bacterium]